MANRRVDVVSAALREMERKGPIRKLYERVALNVRFAMNRKMYDKLDARADKYHEQGGAR